MIRSGLAAGLAEPWIAKLPQCEDSDSGPRGTLWHRWRWRNSGVRLEGAWYCSSLCFERALGRRISRALAGAAKAGPVRHRIPLGLLLLSRGELTDSQLLIALAAQRANGTGCIGEWLQKLGFVTLEQVTVALGLQWACPVLPVATLDIDCACLVPYRLLALFRMVPIRFVAARRALYVAFSEGIHYPALYAIESMLNCRTEPCLIQRPALKNLLLQLHEHIHVPDLVFDNQPVAETARIATGYAFKLDASEVRVAAIDGSVWIRLDVGRTNTDLLFTRVKAEFWREGGAGLARDHQLKPGSVPPIFNL